MNTLIFIVALSASAMCINDYIASVMDFVLSGNKRYDLKTPYLKSVFSCVLWGAYYYITNNA